MKRILLDVDTGVDDALALLFALRSPELEVVAITTVAGNVPVENCTRNTRQILDLLEASPEILVAQGAEKPLERELHTASFVHGEDGLGNVSQLYPVPQHPLDPRPAADVILAQIEKYGEDLTLVPTGPMTNIALAARQDPELFATVGGIVQMGGAVGVPGNTGPWSEFNIFVDPEAAAEVVATGVPLRLVPLDVTHRVILLREEMRRLADKGDSRTFQFAREITVLYFDYQQKKTGLNGGYLHDPTAVAAVIEPGMFIWEPAELTVRTDEEERGRTVAQPAPAEGTRHWVATEVDYQRVLKLFTGRVCR
jgi:inosine-uridine nucleoside N-ribohydrolase